MNAKKVKTLRKMLRNAGVNLRQAVYSHKPSTAPKTFRLHHECGRGVYVAAKAMAKAA